MKSLKEFLTEAKNSPAKEFFNLYKAFYKAGVGTSGATEEKVDSKHKTALDNILKFLENYKVENIEDISDTSLYIFVNKKSSKTNLYISVLRKDNTFTSAELFIGKGTWIYTKYNPKDEMLKLESYVIPNAFANNEDGQYFVDYLGRNLIGDIESEKLLK